MPITFVQKGLSTGASNSLTVSLTFTGGNTILVGIVLDDAASTITSVGDGGTNTYTVTPNSPASNTGKAYIYQKINCVGGALTITVQFNNANTHSMWVREFAGLGAGTLHSDVAGTGGPGTTINTPSVTNTAGDLLFAVTYDSGGVTATGAPWAATDGNVQNGEADEYILSSAGGSQAVNWATSSGSWAAMAVSFTPAAAAGGAITMLGRIGP